MLRQPNRLIYVNNVTNTNNSTDTFNVPFGDFDGLVGKLSVQTLLAGTGATLNVYLQTTDDGGATWYDMVSFTQATGVVTTAAANWATIPVNIGDGKYNSTLSDATLTAGTVAGLPLLGNSIRVKWVTLSMAMTTASINWNIKVYANNQSPHA